MGGFLPQAIARRVPSLPSGRARGQGFSGTLQCPVYLPQSSPRAFREAKLMDGFERSHPENRGPKGGLTRRDFVVTSITAGFALAVQPVQAQTVITTDTNGLTVGPIEIPVSDGTIPGYYARPDGKGPYATVLVIHEAWGVHEHIQDVCRRLPTA